MIQGLMRLSGRRSRFTNSLAVVFLSQFIRKLWRLSSRVGIFHSEENSNSLYIIKGRLLATSYCADFICFDSVVVELKALAHMGGTEEAQVINYLKATGYEVGLLLNFGGVSLQHRRLVLSKSASSASSADNPYGRPEQSLGLTRS